MLDRIIIILSLCCFALLFYGLLQSRKQFYKIQAAVEKRKYRNLLTEHIAHGPRYFLNGSMLDFLNINFFIYYFDKSILDNIEEEIKPLYLKKFSYEKMACIGFISNILMAVIMGILGKNNIHW